MKIFAGIVVLVAFVLVTEAWYDCRRAGQDCLNDAICNYTSGLCDCGESDLQGEDCGFNKTQAATGCDPPCQNGGSCYNDTSGQMCYCPSDYTGSECQFKRGDVTCSGNEMNITVRPFPGFGGLIYVRNNKTDTECQLAESTSSPGVFTANLNLEGPECSPVIRNDTPNANDTTYEREIFVQYSRFFESSVDQLLTIACIIQAPDVSTLNGSFAKVDEEGGQFDQKKASDTLDPIRFVVQRGDGSAITPPTKVGDPLRLYFTLKDKNIFTNFLVEECTVHNGLTGVDKKDIRLIENSCLTPVSKQVIRGLMKRDNAVPSVELPLAAFKFDNSPDLAFTCNVRVCKTGDTKCDPRSCKFGQGYGRRRRDVTSDPAASGSERLVEQRITVVEEANPYGLVTAPQQVEEKSCFSKPEVLTVVAVLGVLVLMLMLLAAVMATRHFRRNGGMSHKELDSQSTYSSSLSSQLHIPRVKASM